MTSDARQTPLVEVLNLNSCRVGKRLKLIQPPLTFTTGLSWMPTRLDASHHTLLQYCKSESTSQNGNQNPY